MIHLMFVDLLILHKYHHQLNKYEQYDCDLYIE
jgi:hypothetical protein